MESIDPQKRPNCLDVLEEVLRIKSNLPPDVLLGPLPMVASAVESQIKEPTTRPQTTPLTHISQEVVGEVVANALKSLN